MLCLVIVHVTCSRVPDTTEPVVVAASNSSPESKARAGLVCDGTHDEEELAASIASGGRFSVDVDASPNRKHTVECVGRHCVDWLPGDYHLGDALVVPGTADTEIRAEGTVFHYDEPTGDAVRVCGMYRSRIRLGTIHTASDGAALRLDCSDMPAQMSLLTFTGLIGTNRRGIGFAVDGGSTNRFEGTDVSDFDTGVYVADVDGKIDTCWFWLSYVRRCNTCINERQRGVDDNVWRVNVDACYPDTVGIRTAAAYGSWYVIMGVLPTSTAIVLDPGALHNVIEVHPPLEGIFKWEDRSGNDTNVVLTSRRAPLRPIV